MALLETQPLRTNVSASGGPQAPTTVATRSTVAFALSTGITASDQVGATSLLFEYRGGYDHGRHDPYRPGPYRPGPYYPRPYPMPLPYPVPGYPSPLPGPFPGERACAPWEAGRIGSRQDVFGQWWCSW